MSKENLDLKEDIKNFQISLTSHIRSFKKRLIEPGNIQFIPESFFHTTDDALESYIKEASLEENFDYFLSKRNESVYKMCCDASLPLSSSKLFRFLHLRIFSIILESASQACRRKHPIEVCFHLRSFLEHAANFSYALDEIIPMSKELLININEYNVMPVLGVPNSGGLTPTSEFAEISTRLHKKFALYSYQTNIDAEQLTKGKGSLVPDKEYPLKSINIRKKLEAFNKRNPLLQPIYDYLSEYIHPNRYIFTSATSEGSLESLSEENPYISFEDLKLEDGMSEIGYFFGEHHRSFLQKITLEILERDSEFFSLQGKISKKMKVSFKKVINYNKFYSDPFVSKAPCVCQSKKKLIDCCAS